MATKQDPVPGCFQYIPTTGAYRYVKQTGYLIKSPAVGKRGRWRKRWFLLADSVQPSIQTGIPERQIRLEYYAAWRKDLVSFKQMPKLKGVIELRSCIAVVSSDERVKGYKYVFNIVMSNFRVHHLVANSDEERDQWIRAMNDFIFSKPLQSFMYFGNTSISQHKSVYGEFLSSTGYCTKDDNYLEESTHVRHPAYDAGHDSDDCIIADDNNTRAPRLGHEIRERRSRRRVQGSIGHVVKDPGQSMKTRVVHRFASADTAMTEPVGRPGQRFERLYDNELKRRSMERSKLQAAADDLDLLCSQLNDWNVTEIGRSDIRFSDFISSGTVSKGTWKRKKASKTVAIKTAAASNQERLLQEGVVLGQLMHPNVVKLLGVVVTGQPKLLVIEFCSKGNLSDHLKSLQPKATSTKSKAADTKSLQITLLKFSRETSMGLSYLADKNIVHGVIMAANVLVAGDDTCKITGLGKSLRVEDDQSHILHKDAEFAIQWAAPEITLHGKYSKSSDLWSLGVLFYEIWSLGCTPYKHLSLANTEVTDKLIHGYRLPPPPGCPKPIYELMIQCWHPQAHSRPDCGTIVKYLLQQDIRAMSSERHNSRHKQPKGASKAQSLKDSAPHRIGAELKAGEVLYKELQETYRDLDLLVEDELEPAASTTGMSSEDLEAQTTPNKSWTVYDDDHVIEYDDDEEEEEIEQESPEYDKSQESPEYQASPASPAASLESSYEGEYWNDLIYPKEIQEKLMKFDLSNSVIIPSDNEVDSTVPNEVPFGFNQVVSKLPQLESTFLKRRWSFSSGESDNDEQESQARIRDGLSKEKKSTSNEKCRINDNSVSYVNLPLQISPQLAVNDTHETLSKTHSGITGPSPMHTVSDDPHFVNLDQRNNVLPNTVQFLPDTPSSSTCPVVYPDADGNRHRFQSPDFEYLQVVGPATYPGTNTALQCQRQEISEKEGERLETICSSQVTENPLQPKFNTLEKEPFTAEVNLLTQPSTISSHQVQPESTAHLPDTTTEGSIPAIPNRPLSTELACAGIRGRNKSRRILPSSSTSSLLQPNPRNMQSLKHRRVKRTQTSYSPEVMRQKPIPAVRSLIKVRSDSITHRHINRAKSGSKLGAIVTPPPVASKPASHKRKAASKRVPNSSSDTTTTTTITKLKRNAVQKTVSLDGADYQNIRIPSKTYRRENRLVNEDGEAIASDKGSEQFRDRKMPLLPPVPVQRAKSKLCITSSNRAQPPNVSNGHRMLHATKSQPLLNNI